MNKFLLAALMMIASSAFAAGLPRKFTRDGKPAREDAPCVTLKPVRHAKSQVAFSRVVYGKQDDGSFVGAPQIECQITAKVPVYQVPDDAKCIAVNESEAAICESTTQDGVKFQAEYWSVITLQPDSKMYMTWTNAYGPNIALSKGANSRVFDVNLKKIQLSSSGDAIHTDQNTSEYISASAIIEDTP